MVKNRLRECAAAVLLLVAAVAWGQVPEVQNPPRLVNDFAAVFTPEQAKEMEDSLALFNKKTSNQITVVTMNDFGGMDKAQMAYSIGEKWGVGGEKFNNGVVILVKPKVGNSRGEVFIATGYGIEGALPDAACRNIIENEMIPEFKQDDYYAGVNAALAVVKPIMAKEYTYEQYEKDNELPLWAAVLIVILAGVFVFIFIRSLKNSDKNGNNSGTLGGGGFFIGGLPMSGGNSSSGSSGFGGFGGFGGGSFGGGGAGGSW